MVSPEPNYRPELGMVSPEPGGVRYGVPGTQAELGMVSPEPRNPPIIDRR